MKRHPLLGLCLLGSIVCTSAISSAAEDAQKDKLSSFLSGGGLQVKFSLKSDLRARKSAGAYEISFKDAVLVSSGTIAQPTDFKLSEDPIKFGDAPLSLQIVDGASTVGGGFLSAIGVAPFSLGSNFAPKSLRFIAGLDAPFVNRDNSGTFSRFFGIEYRPFSGLADGNRETFLGLSARYENQSKKSGKTEEKGALALRARFGGATKLVLSEERANQIDNERLALIDFLRGRIKPQTKVTSVKQVAAALDQFQVERGYSITNSNKDLVTLGSFAIKGEIERAFTRAWAGSDRELQRAFEASSRQAFKDYQESSVQSTLTVGDRVDRLFSSLKADLKAYMSDPTNRMLVSRSEEIAKIDSSFDEVSAEVGTEIAIKILGVLEQITPEQSLDSIKSSAAKNNPQLAYFLELDGSYAFAGASDIRARGIYSLNLRYNFDAKKEDGQYLWLRAEYGKTRAEPNVPIATISLMFNYKF